MFFRPYPVLTLIAIPMLAALIALGLWQLQRAAWKADLIATYERTADQTPQSLEQALCTAGEPLGRIVAPPLAAGPRLRMFGHAASGAAGWRLFQAASNCAAGEAPILVETGFEPLAIGGEIGGVPPGPQAAPDRFVVEAWPEKSLLTAENVSASNEWHWFDAAAMAAALRLPALDARYILAARTGMPDYLTRTPPSGHIGYAVTWFGMAIGFVLIYAAFHARAGRLRLRKPQQGRP